MTLILFAFGAGWVCLSLSALVGKLTEFVVVVTRIARAVEAQNAHYGIKPATLEKDDAEVRA